jgi:pimeloyl-ACP methyl ester carboxylesterase
MVRRALPGLVTIEHRFDVPLRHDEPDGERIALFAREVRSPRAADEERPYLLFLNGGPGFPCFRPTGPEGFLATALDEFHVVLLDQRGTGLSTPADASTLPERGDAAAQAEYLTWFRADSIVRDAELLRERLGGKPWSVLGQSFGGFCVTTYLSFAPEGLREAFVTGGLPPVGHRVDDVYRRLVERHVRRLEVYFERYPEDRERWAQVPQRWLRTPAQVVGMSTGPDELHHLIEFVEASGLQFGERAAQEATMATTPLYALLHEAIYAEGEATRWAAHRIVEECGGLELPGEMIFPWLFEDDPGLKPLAEAAHLLAEKDDWPALYDRERLAANEVPVVAAVYLDDTYVDVDLSLETAAGIRGARTWITNELQHDGLRVGDAFKRLLAMQRGEA